MWYVMDIGYLHSILIYENLYCQRVLIKVPTKCLNVDLYYML